MELENTEKPAVQTKQVIAKELQLAVAVPEPEAAQVSPEIAAQADDIISKLMLVDEKDLQGREKHARAIRTLGEPIQAELAKQSQILKAPMTTLMKDSEDGGAVARDLLMLQEQVNEINPNKVDFSMSAVRRMLSKLPGVGTPLARWFAKYQAVDSVINDIIASLKHGRAQLQRDNDTLKDDQLRMRELTFKLQDYIVLAQLLDRKLQQAIDTFGLEETEKKAFFEEELLFPLRQRIVDLQQQLAVNQQGVLATEVIIRNNRELITGVNRALNVTSTALNTAATLQIALQHQKKVLKGVEAVTQTTNELIAGTAEQLKTQGTEIQKRAASATLDVTVLKKAFLDVQQALEDISTFRREALPEMATSIVEMDTLTSEMEGALSKMERGNAVSNDLVFELTDGK